MDNPFSFGSIVNASCFINRSKEILELSNDIASNQNVLLYADRRFGKTSLINKVIQSLPKDHIKVFLDISSFYSLEHFLETYTSKFYENLRITSFSKLKNFFTSNLPFISPNISLDNSGKTSFSLNFASRDIKKNSEDILNLPLKFKNRKIVIVFDEFQEINSLQKNFTTVLRSIIQHHSNVSYIFCGSKRHILLQMFNKKSEPFFKSAKLMKLSKIPEKEMKTFIKNGFKKAKIDLQSEILESIIRVTENIPYHIQQLSHTLWYKSFSTKKADKTTLENSIDSILNNFQDYYVEIWHNLSKEQRALLSAISKNGGKNILSKDYLLENRLSSTPAIAKNSKILIEKTHLTNNNKEYRFQDPFFRMWIKRNI